MATKADFTPEEWQVFQWAVLDTMAYMSLAEKGFWDTFKEASAAAKYLADAKASSTSLFVRDLAGDVKSKKDSEVSGNPADMAGEVAERVSEAAGIVAEKAADELEAFKGFILGVAEATAAAADGVGPNEAQAIEKIRAALG
jgi:hypothetical protein